MWPFKTKTSDTKMSSSSRTDPTDATIQSVDPLIAVPANILQGRMQDISDNRAQNRYALSDALYNADERLYSAVELMAIMIEKSIGDISIASIRNDDKTLTNEEENAIKVANDWAKDIAGVGLRKLFYHYTIDLWKYGDAVDVIKFNSSGVTDLIPLPMQAVTAVDRRSQINAAISFNDPMIMNPKWYVVDEQQSAPLIQDNVFKKERILHISFNPRRNQMRDNMTRWTMNVWSMPPITSLIGILTWKQNLIRNDMVWRQRAMPREHHKLDLSQYDLSKFSGTFAQKQAASLAAAQAAIEKYNTNMRRREADQGFVTGQGVAIEWIQPKVNFTDPTPIIDQINNLLGGPTGTPAALMGGESKGFTSLVQSTSFLALRAEIYAEKIQRKLTEVMKRHVKLARPGIRAAVVDRLYIKNRLILDRDRTELAKIIAVLVESKAFTMDEIRRIWGLDPATDAQVAEIRKWLKMINPVQKTTGTTGKQAADDLLKQKQNTAPTAGQESPGKRSRDLIQKGGRRSSV